MLGPMVIGARAAEEQAAIEAIGASQLGPMVITPRDRERLLADKGLTVESLPPAATPPAAPEGPKDPAMSFKAIEKALRENPARVREIVATEASRIEAGLPMRRNVLRTARIVAAQQEDAELVASIDTALSTLAE